MSVILAIPSVVIVTCALNDTDHLVTLENMAEGMAEGRGYYRAECDAVVLSAALIAPPGRTCPACASVATRRHNTSWTRPPTSCSPPRRHRTHRPLWRRVRLLMGERSSA